LIDMRIQAILRILKRIIANVEIKIKYDEINRKFENGKITKGKVGKRSFIEKIRS
jgi:hypothetical protein